MLLVFSQPNLDVPDEEHLYFDTGDSLSSSAPTVATTPYPIRKISATPPIGFTIIDVVRTVHGIRVSASDDDYRRAPHDQNHCRVRAVQTL